MWTTVILNPGLYALNMAMIKEKFKWKHSMRGVVLNGATVVPQTMFQVLIFKQMKKLVSPEKNEKELSIYKKVLLSMGAGGASGVLTAWLEMALLQYQKENGEAIEKGIKTEKGITIREIFTRAYELGGIPRLNIGALALLSREMIWAPAYQVITPAISRVYGSMISNEYVRDFGAAATSGAIAGFFTNATNFLRAQKQNEALKSGVVRSYVQIIEEAGFAGLFRGVCIRMPVVAFACVLMTGGGKVVSYIEKKVGE